MNRLFASLAVLGLFAFTSSSVDAAHQTAPVGANTVSNLLNAPVSAVASQDILLANNCGYGGGYNRGYYRPSYNTGYRGGYGGGYGGYRGGYGGGFYGRPAFGYGGYGGGYGRGYNRGGFGLYIGF